MLSVLIAANTRINNSVLAAIIKSFPCVFKNKIHHHTNIRNIYEFEIKSHEYTNYKFINCCGLKVEDCNNLKLETRNIPTFI